MGSSHYLILNSGTPATHTWNLLCSCSRSSALLGCRLEYDVRFSSIPSIQAVSSLAARRSQPLSADSKLTQLSSTWFTDSLSLTSFGRHFISSLAVADSWAFWGWCAAKSRFTACSKHHCSDHDIGALSPFWVLFPRQLGYILTYKDSQLTHSLPDKFTEKRMFTDAISKHEFNLWQISFWV